MDAGMSRRNKPLEQWMRLMGFAVKLGMKLAGNEEGMFGQFDYFDQFAIRRQSAEHKVGFLKSFPVRIIEFVAMPMALIDDKGAIATGSFCIHDQLAGLRTETHRAAFFDHPFLLIQHGNDRM